MGAVDLVLITWNSSSYLDRCLEGIREQTLKPRLIVVDNDSSDGTLQRIEKEKPDLLIRNEANTGYAHAANQGIEAGRAAYTCVLNPDAWLQPEYLERLVGTMEDAGPECGTVSGKLLRGRGSGIAPTGLVDSLGMRMTRSGRHLDIGAGEEDDGASDVREVFGVSGAAILLRRTLIEAVRVEGDVFDSDFFSYREDADLAWRARLFGWRSFCDRGAVGYHVRRVSPEARRELPASINFHGVKNRFLLRMKNAGKRLWLQTLPWTMARDLIVLGATLTVERSSLPAWSWIWRNRARVLGKRRDIQARRVVRDGEIMRWFA
jgi:GT2 family glycosyltransferase